MDIHKPKPWHGLREFLKEYVIIVVGVLTALGAEQGVEWLHWRHLATRAEEELAAGLQPDLLNAADEVSAKPCYRAWLGPLSAGLQTPDPVWRGAPLHLQGAGNSRLTPSVFETPGDVWSHAAWETATASGVLNHMPQERVKQYAEVYREVELARGLVVSTADTMDELAPLAIDRRLAESEKAAYLQRLAHLDRIVGNKDRLSRQILKGAHALGVDPAADKIRARLDKMRRFYGPCVADVNLPLS
jgi:hypothetical protein